MITWRGILAKIACFPYNFREGVKLVVLRKNSTTYIIEEKDVRESLSTEKLHPIYFGKKFESLCTLDSLEFDAWRGVQCSSNGFMDMRMDSEVEPFAEFGGVMEAKLGNVSLVYGAELDCIDNRKIYIPVDGYMAFCVHLRGHVYI